MPRAKIAHLNTMPKLLADLNVQKSKSPRNKYTERDQNKLLFQEREGLISYFGKYDRQNEVETGRVVS